MKNYLVLFVYFLILIIRANEMKFVSEVEGGKLYTAGKINVVVMKGNFYQMGRQYGALLKKEYREFYDIAAKQIGIGTKKAPYEEVLAVMKDSLNKQPFYVRELVRGIGETSGLGAEKQIIASQLLFPITCGCGAGNCSGLIAWGEYTQNGSSIAGRNWDMRKDIIEPYQKFLTVAVFNPTGYGQSVADINYLGQVVWQSAINKSGIFYDFQNGGMSDPTVAKNRLGSNSALMSMMLNSTSFSQVDAFFDAVRAQNGILINITAPKQGACYEWGTTDYRKHVNDDKGLVASANHFTDPTWRASTAIPDGKEGGFTNERTANLLALGKKYKGQIDAKKMMDIFSTTIPQGGPSFPVNSNLKTYYSIVAVPEELKLWLKVYNLQDWTEIDLKSLFR